MNHRFWGPNGVLSDMIRQHFPEGYQGHAIDVGASDGVSVNSTFLLEKTHRWTVLSVEANPEYKPYLNANRAFVEVCACASEPRPEATFYVHLDNPEAYSALNIAAHPKNHAAPNAKWTRISVPVKTVEQLLAKWEFPKLDALCVDTEGTEVDVLKGFNLDRWKPKVIVVECWDKSGPTHDYLKEKGYDLNSTSVDNFLYLRRA